MGHVCAEERAHQGSLHKLQKINAQDDGHTATSFYESTTRKSGQTLAGAVTGGHKLVLYSAPDKTQLERRWDQLARCHYRMANKHECSVCDT